MSGPFAAQNTYPHLNEPRWSGSERVIARKVFDAALKEEHQHVTREAKQMANQIKEPADVWELERYLTQRRKDIDRKYDYRYSQLRHVFGTLSYEGRVSEQELCGLRDDKLKSIRSLAKFSAEDSAA
jgi:hypothetical protein